MNKYKKMASLTAASFIIGMASPAWAEQDAPTTPDEDYNVMFTYDGEIEYPQSEDWTGKANIGLELKANDTFKANLAGDLYRAYKDHVDDDFDWESFIIEANITVDLNSEGVPVVIVVGKQRKIPFKYNLSDIPKSDLNSLEANGTAIEEVMGVTMAVSTEMLDDLSFSVAETNGDDMDFDSDQVRITARAKKALNATVDIYGSLSYELNKVSDDGWQASLGAVFDVSKYTVPGLEAYVQGTRYVDYGTIGTATGWDIGLNYNVDELTGVQAAVEVLDDDTEYRIGVSRIIHKKTQLKASAFLYAINPGDDDEDTGVQALLSLPLQKGWRR